jgi:hypothetical protein
MEKLLSFYWKIENQVTKKVVPILWNGGASKARVARHDDGG